MTTAGTFVVARILADLYRGSNSVYSATMRLSVSDDVNARPLHRVVAEAVGNGQAVIGADLVQNGVAGLDRVALQLRRTLVTLAITATLVSICAAIAADAARGSNAASYFQSAMLIAAAVALGTGAVLLQLWRGLLPSGRSVRTPSRCLWLRRVFWNS